MLSKTSQPKISSFGIQSLGLHDFAWQALNHLNPKNKYVIESIGKTKYIIL